MGRRSRKALMIRWIRTKGQRVGGSISVGIQDAMGDPGRGALAKYRALVVGSDSLWDLVVYELVVTLTSWVPGALGLLLRKLTYQMLLGSVCRHVVVEHR